MTNKIINLRETKNFKRRHNLGGENTSCGLPGPAKPVNDDLLKKLPPFNPDWLKVCTITGDSMEPLIVDKQRVILDCLLPGKLTADDLKGKIVVASIEGKESLSRFDHDEKYFYLKPENKKYDVIKIGKTAWNFKITAVVVDILSPGL